MIGRNKQNRQRSAETRCSGTRRIVLSDLGSGNRLAASWLTCLLLVIAAAAAAGTFPGNDPLETPRTSPAIASVSQTSAGTGDDSARTVPASGSPKISVPEPSFDFGTVAQGTKPSHTFIVLNVGDAPLKLIKAKGT